MATAAFQPPSKFNKYYLNPHTGLLSSETYFYGETTSTSPSAMADEEPQWKNTFRRTSPDDYRTDVAQLRPRRKPLGFPAALRPTESSTNRSIPSRPQPPDTPPASQGNSFDSANATTQLFDGEALLLDGQNEQQLGSGRVLHRVDTGARLLLDGPYEEVTGPPTTAHWKPDATAKCCRVCRAPFTWWFRRHHCRRCGYVVCDNHFKHTVPLDQNARFHPDGQESKSCNLCYEDWKAIKKLRDSRAGSIDESNAGSQENPTEALAIPQQRTRGTDEQRVGSVARSEGGMVWSTF